MGCTHAHHEVEGASVTVTRTETNSYPTPICEDGVMGPPAPSHIHTLTESATVKGTNQRASGKEVNVKADEKLPEAILPSGGGTRGGGFTLDASLIGAKLDIVAILCFLSSLALFVGAGLLLKFQQSKAAIAAALLALVLLSMSLVPGLAVFAFVGVSVAVAGYGVYTAIRSHRHREALRGVAEAISIAPPGTPVSALKKQFIAKTTDDTDKKVIDQILYSDRL